MHAWAVAPVGRGSLPRDHAISNAEVTGIIASRTSPMVWHRADGRAGRAACQGVQSRPHAAEHFDVHLIGLRVDVVHEIGVAFMLESTPMQSFHSDVVTVSAATRRRRRRCRRQRRSITWQCTVYVAAASDFLHRHRATRRGARGFRVATAMTAAPTALGCTERQGSRQLP